MKQIINILSILTAMSHTINAVPSLHTDLPYRTEPNAPKRCALDLYIPVTTGKPPVLVWFHGGSLIEGHKSDDFNLKVAAGFRDLGMAVAMINYRLSPSVKFPIYVEDAAAAIAWVVKNAAAYNLDSSRVYVGGHSAGGYLALLTTLDPHYLRAAGIDATSLCGVISLSAQTLTHSTILQERGPGTPAIVADEGAPLHFAIGPAPRLLLLCAENDVPARIEENQLLAALLRRTPGNKIELQIIPDRDHMSIIEKATDPADPVAAAVHSFMDK